MSVNEGRKSKSVALNSVFNAAYMCVNTLFPIVATAYVARKLLPGGVGDVTYAQTVVNYFVLVAALGLPNYGVKTIAHVSDDRESRTKAFQELFFINLISTVVCITAYYVFVNTLPHFSGRRELFNITGITLILNAFGIDWFYQGMEEYKIISIRGTIVRVVSFLLIVAFVRSPGDYLKYALILSIGVAANNIYNVLLVRKYVGLKLRKINLKQHVRPILLLLASVIAAEVYMMLDTVMLEYYHGSETVAYYTNSAKIVRATYLLIISIAAPIYPKISWYIKNRDYENSNRLLNRYSKLIYLIAVPAVIGLVSTADRLIPLLFGNRYEESVGVAVILGILVFVFSTAYLFGHIILLAAGDEKHILIATVLGAVSNVCLNLMLIPGYKQYGAAIASVSAELIVTFMLIFYSRKILNIHFGIPYLVSVLLSSAVMAVAVLFGNGFLPRTVIWTLVLVIGAALIYLVMLILTRNEVLREVFTRVRRRIAGERTNE